MNPKPDQSTILIIDDDKKLSTLVNKILVTEGYQTAVANSFVEVEGQLAEMGKAAYSAIDLILLDLVMPDTNGIEMYHYLRTQAITSETPIIILTGIDSVEKRVELLDLGADDYIVKPFLSDELLARVAVYTQLNELRRAKHLAEKRVAVQTGYLATINTIAHRAARHLQIDKMLVEVVQAVVHFFEFDVSRVYLYDKETDTLVLSASSHAHGTEMSVPSPVRQVIGQRKSVIQEAEAAVPIWHDDEFIGALLVLNEQAPLLTEVVPTLEVLATQLSTSMTNAYLFQNVRRRNHELNVLIKENKRLLAIEQRQRQQAEQLHKMAQIISSSLEIEDVLVAAVDSLKTMIQVERGAIFLLDKEGKQLSFVRTLNEGEKQLTETALPADKGIVGLVVRQGKPLIVNDVQQHPHFFPTIDEMTGQRTRSVLGVPLIVLDRVIGAVELLNKKEGNFTEMDLTLVSSVATSIAAALDNANLYRAQAELINEIAHSQEQLLQSEKLAATGRLAASLAHEINNPLQAIHSCLQLALHFDLNPHKQTEYLGMANEEVERLIDLITRVLDFVRPSSAAYKPVNINKIIGQVVRLTDKHVHHHQWEIQQILASDVPLVQAVPDQIAQVCLGIILNAFDAMPAGGVLTIKTRVQDERVEIVFEDTGVGMAPAVQKRIFEPFFTTKKEDASGLGLAISYGIIERHAGKIHVKSQVNVGSIFTVSLPYMPK